MRRFLALFSAVFALSVAGPSPARADAAFGWTISASSTDPNVNTGAATNGIATLYIWLQCSAGSGLVAAEFNLCTTGTIFPLALTPLPPFLNVGPPPPDTIVLAAGGCPTGPLPAASLLILDLPGSLCFCPSGQGLNHSVECGTLDQVPNRYRGYSNVGPPCETSASVNLCEGPVSVEGRAWGRIKAGYR